MSVLGGNLVITPYPTSDMGNVIVGNPATLDFVLLNNGNQSLEIGSYASSGGAEWSLVGLALPYTLDPATSVGLTLTITAAGVGAKATNIDVAWSDDYGNGGDPLTAVSATAIAPVAGGHIEWQPSALSFVSTQLLKHLDLVVNLKNTGGAGCNLTILAFTTGTSFSLIGAPVLPLALAAGAQQALTVRFAPALVGLLTDTLTATSDVPSTAALDLAGVGELLKAIAICANNDRRVMLGGYDINGLAGKPAPLILTPDDYNADQAGNIVFNGAVWEGLGVEKTLLRLGFYYENFGIATLTGTVNCFRPQIAPDTIDSKPFSVTFGTALADGTTRYAEADLVATGEILTLTLARAAAAGPISIVAIMPYFEPRGEKVKDV